MVDPTDKDTNHIKDQSTDTEGYLKYIKEKEKWKVNQIDVGNKKDQQNSGSNNPRTSKNSKKKKWRVKGESAAISKNVSAIFTIFIFDFVCFLSWAVCVRKTLKSIKLFWR